VNLHLCSLSHCPFLFFPAVRQRHNEGYRDHDADSTLGDKFSNDVKQGQGDNQIDRPRFSTLPDSRYAAEEGSPQKTQESQKFQVLCFCVFVAISLYLHTMSS
jgi:hypothetical protein